MLSAVAAGSALFVTGGATAAQPESATGGGQVFLSPEEAEAGGAGSTIAFTARSIDGEFDTAARGQVQYVERTGGTGQGQLVTHGTVDCLETMSNGEQGVAFIEGTWTRGDEVGRFRLYVEDNGEGAQAAGNDIVTMMPGDDTPECDFDAPDDDGKIVLYRGNAQVRPEA